MASSSFISLPRLAILLSLLGLSLATRTLTTTINETPDQTQQQEALSFRYHSGQLLTGKLSINLVWYGHFQPSQRAIVSDFIASLSSSPAKTRQPSVATWWQGTGRYYRHVGSSTPSFTLGTQVWDDSYSLGKSLTQEQLLQLASKGGGRAGSAIAVVLTSSDVAVEGFCSSRCGTHGSSGASGVTYVWVGNSETQCPGYCAWPFHQPIYGPQGPPLVAPNNDVGLDGMVINLAGLLAGTVTNPYGNGYFQGPKEAPLEAASACPGIYAKGAYPGYPGDLLVDPTSGASYNANGVNGRKYLVPALFDPSTSTCSTLV